MAIGDIGAIIDTRQLDTAARYGYLVRRLGDSQNFVLSTNLSVSLRTFSIGADGVVGSTIDTFAEATGLGSANGSSLMHVYGDVYACFAYSLFGGEYGVFTVSIDEDGNIGAVNIASLASQIYGCRNLPIEIGDTGSAKLFAVNDVYAINSPRLSTWSISYSGATITLLDTDSYVTPEANGYGDIVEVTDDIVMLTYSDSGGSIPKVYTYNVANGLITGVDSLNLANSGAATSIRSVKVASGIFASFFYDNEAAVTTIKTYNIDGSGNIGAVIDTDTGAFPAGTSFDNNFDGVLAIGSQKFLVGYHNSSKHYVGTIGISATGTIDAALTDSLYIQDDQAGGSQSHILKITDGIYGAIYKYSTYPWIKTFAVAEGVASDAVSDRVGSIRHIYRPGVYKAEITLGGLSRGIDYPDLYSAPGRLTSGEGEPVPTRPPDIPEPPPHIEPTPDVSISPGSKYITDRAMQEILNAVKSDQEMYEIARATSPADFFKDLWQNIYRGNPISRVWKFFTGGK
jgi:hypothetical protein